MTARKLAIVTGGSGSIGRAIATEFAKNDIDVALCYAANQDSANEVRHEVEASGVRSSIFQLDQRDPDSIDLAIDRIADYFGRIDILVNNAAWNVGIPFPDLDALTPGIWDRLLETNLRGPFLLARKSANFLKADGGGHIVNISSNGGIAPTSSSIGYSASKAGLIHLTRCLAVALAPEVAVNCIAPGVVMNTNISRRMPPEVLDAECEMAVLGRAAQLEDIAKQVLMLCTMSSISGQTITIDGGMPIAMR